MRSATETRSRRGDTAHRAIEDAIRHLQKARGYVRESTTALRRDDHEKCDEFFGMASECVADALETVGSPTEPAVGAADLPPRKAGSRSVPVIGSLDRFAWASERFNNDRRAILAADRLNVLGLDARKLSSQSILQYLADSGWGPAEIADYVKSLMEVTRDEGTIKQRVEVTKLVFGVLQHTEPRTLFELRDVDLADLSEPELEELTRRAAQHVAEEASRLQAGLPPSTKETNT